MKAIEAKKLADELNIMKDTTEFNSILARIKERAEHGYYNFPCDKLRTNVEEQLTDLGYEISPINSDSPVMSGEYNITWDSAEEDLKGISVVYSLPFDDKDASFMGNIQESEVIFINGLAERFPNTVGFRKNMSDVWVCGGIKRPYDVVVYEKGVRGPADWFFLNDNGRWAHGGYTGDSNTYDNIEFFDYVRSIHKNNTEYGN
jgi:hypothetical protein